MNINHVALSGNIAWKGEINSVGNDQYRVIELLLAVDRPSRNSDDTDFFTVQAWAKLA